MATKYGYVSRDRAERQIDWGEIGKQVSDEIVKINEDRKERREDILQKSTDYAKMLVEMPMGSNTAFNEYLAQFTSQASKAALEDLNALKRGEISEQEYYNRRANLKSGTELMIAGANNFNKNYDLIQERIDKGVASLVEIKYREKMAELLEFGNRTPFINPDTREVNTARLAPSGVMETTVEDIASASDMFRISNFQLNKFDMNSAIEDITKNIGIQDVTITPEMVKKAQSEGRAIGAVGTKVKGAFNSALMSEKETELAKKDYVSSYLKDDSAVISILADYVPGYDVTLDPFEVDDKTVLIGRNGAYEITDEQRKAAEDYMIDRLDKALPETETPVADLTAAQKASNELRQQEIDIRRETLEFQKGQLKKEQEVPSISSTTFVFKPTSGEVISANDYITNIDEKKLNTERSKRDFIIDMNAIFTKDDIARPEIIFNEAPMDLKTRPEIRKIPTMSIAVPGIIDEFIKIPLTETFNEDLEKLVNLISSRNKTKEKILTNELDFIPFNRIYNDIPVNVKRALPKPNNNNE